MTKQHFISLADHIKWANDYPMIKFSQAQIVHLADWCQKQNPRFDRQRWLDYIAGTHGPNGGKK